MELKRLYIKQFGGLQEREFLFSPGLNVLFGGNEAGKSTLLACVRFLFYGAKFKKEPGQLSWKEKYLPWQGGKYGVRLRASAPSIHMMRADIQTEVSPIVGSEKQSEELVKFLLDEFEENPKKIWESNIFGKSLHELVNEGLHNKLYRMPTDARLKLQETIERIINEGCSGLVCIIL